MVFNEGKLVMFDEPSKVFADSGKIKEMGLDVPQGKQVLEALKSRGVNVDTSAYTTEDTIKELLKFFKKNGGNNV